MASCPLFFFILTSMLIPRYNAMQIQPAPSNSTSYIRTCCSHTLYAHLCYATLSPYASRVQGNPVQLVRFAINSTLVHLRPVSARIAALHHRATTESDSYGDHQNTAALKDCSGVLSDAIDLIKKSQKEMVGLEAMVGPEVTWRISNAQTWLSAAITDEDTCIDGFGGESTEGEIGTEVCRRVNRVKQFTSNALALVNGLMN